MKLTKTAVAVAIAGIAAAPMIASADTTLSGVVEVKVQGMEKDDDTSTSGDEAAGSKANIAAGDVLFGVVAEHELDNGLTGYGSLRTDMNSLSEGSGDSADNVYVGIKGGFGDIRFGEIPVMAEYGQVANDLHDLTGAVNGGISYTGAFGPVAIGVGFAPEANEDVISLGAKFTVGGFAIGLGGEERGNQTNASVGASFALAGATVAAHYWVQQPDGNTGDDPTAAAIQVGYGFGGVSAKLTYSQAENVADYETKIRLDLGYAMGGGLTLSTRVTMSDDNKTADDAATTDLNEAFGSDKTEWRVQLSKAF